MKTGKFIVASALLIMSTGTALAAVSMGTSFTYQGRLVDAGQAASGSYDLRFAVYDAAEGPTQVGAAVTNAGIAVVGGLFSATLDFGADIFTGSARWLEIGVRTNGGGAFVTVSPRQPLTAGPYALFASNAGTAAMAATANAVSAGSVGSSSLQANSVTGVKIADGTIQPSDLDPGGFSTTFWKTDGNAGTAPPNHFLGTMDNHPLELRANNSRVLRLESVGDSGDDDSNPDGTVNIIGGSFGNYVAPGVVGAIIGGGGATNYGGWPQVNAVMADYGAVLGGLGNIIRTGSLAAVIAGHGNSIGEGSPATVILGSANSVLTNSPHTLVGGSVNSVGEDAMGSFIAGYWNQIGAGASFSAIAGGENNAILVGSSNSVIGGGRGNVIWDNASGSGIVSGGYNYVGDQGGFIGGGSYNIIKEGSSNAVVSGGSSHRVHPGSVYSFIGGGYINEIHNDSSFAVINGGQGNNIGTNSDLSSIGGGYMNNANSGGSVISGGSVNSIGASSTYTAIGGGRNNVVGNNSTDGAIAGGWANLIESNSLYCAISGGKSNSISGYADGSSIGGGLNNRVRRDADFSRIGGGYFNYIDEGSDYGVLEGGNSNYIGLNADYSFIGGGQNNVIQDNGSWSVIPGGRNNVINTSYSFAAGFNALANHPASFVWSDSSSGLTQSAAANSVTMRAAGGYRFFTSSGTAGAVLAAGTGSWTSMSDRNAKEEFVEVDSQAVLDKVAALPLSTWKYKTQDASIRHIGPMAQDFKAAFQVGETETGISTVDADGVALAAIQGLNRKVDTRLQALQTESAALRAENLELKERLAAIENLLKSGRASRD